MYHVFHIIFVGCLATSSNLLISTFMPNVCALSEFMSRGSVYDFLHKQRGAFKLPSLLKVSIDVSKGMNYLHQNNIIHRDLKTANLLMDENEVRVFHESEHCWFQPVNRHFFFFYSFVFVSITFLKQVSLFLLLPYLVILHCAPPPFFYPLWSFVILLNDICNLMVFFQIVGWIYNVKCSKMLG